jgi:hypothetical protein
MNDIETKPGLALRVVWLDEDLIELGCNLAYGKFAGESSCYTTSPRLHDFADALSRFSLVPVGEPTFRSGLGDGSKACDLHAYAIDKAGHIAVHVRMATDKPTRRPQSVARLEVEMLVEPWSLSQFAKELLGMART